MKNLISLLAVLSSFFIAACATTANYEKGLANWYGHDESLLISRWGPPDSTYNLPNGGKVLTWIRSKTIQSGGYSVRTPVTTLRNGYISGDVNASYSGSSTTYVNSTTPTYNIEMSCTTRFTIINDIVASWTWEGNNCKARNPN